MKLKCIFLAVLCLHAAGAASEEIRLEPGTKEVRIALLRDHPTVTVVHIPASVTSIGDYAFSDAPCLERVEFEPGCRLSSIGDYAFWNCPSLKEIDLPPVQKIGTGCFKNCASLTRIGLPKGIRELPQHFASWCPQLREVNLPAGLQKLDKHAFAYCAALPSIELPSSLKTVGNNAFSRCTALTEVVVPASVVELGSYAFSDCSSLQSATLPANGSELGELIFSGCESLRTLVLPSLKMPKIECNSFIFEPDEKGLYGQCTLMVPANSLRAYRMARPWKMFGKVEPIPGSR